jgi:hypothetical protein
MKKDKTLTKAELIAAMADYPDNAKIEVCFFPTSGGQILTGINFVSYFSHPKDGIIEINAKERPVKTFPRYD